MITIKHIDSSRAENYEDIESKLYNLTSLCKDKKLKQIVRSTAEEVSKMYKDTNQTESDYLNQWKPLLGKYYKADYYRETEYGKYSKLKYIHPYDIIEENGTIWMQSTEPCDCYNGGVHDGCVRVDEAWYYDITLEEITQEEFKKQAYNSVDYIINRRWIKENTLETC